MSDVYKRHLAYHIGELWLFFMHYDLVMMDPNWVKWKNIKDDHHLQEYKTVC